MFSIKIAAWVSMRSFGCTDSISSPINISCRCSGARVRCSASASMACSNRSKASKNTSPISGVKISSLSRIRDNKLSMGKQIRTPSSNLHRAESPFRLCTARNRAVRISREVGLSRRRATSRSIAGAKSAKESTKSGKESVSKTRNIISSLPYIPPLPVYDKFGLFINNNQLK